MGTAWGGEGKTGVGTPRSGTGGYDVAEGKSSAPTYAAMPEEHDPAEEDGARASRAPSPREGGFLTRGVSAAGAEARCFVRRRGPASRGAVVANGASSASVGELAGDRAGLVERLPEVGDDLLPGGRAVLAAAGDHPLDELDEARRRRPATAGSAGFGQACAVRLHHLGERRGGDRGPPREELAERQPERVDVRPEVERLAVRKAEELLRRGVVELPEESAELGEAARGLGRGGPSRRRSRSGAGRSARRRRRPGCCPGRRRDGRSPPGPRPGAPRPPG